MMVALNGEWLEGEIKKFIVKRAKLVKTEKYTIIIEKLIKRADCINCLMYALKHVEEALFNEKENQTFLPIGENSEACCSVERMESPVMYVQDMLQQEIITMDEYKEIVEHLEDVVFYSVCGNTYLAKEVDLEIETPMFESGTIGVYKIIKEMK